MARIIRRKDFDDAATSEHRTHVGVEHPGCFLCACRGTFKVPSGGADDHKAHRQFVKGCGSCDLGGFRRSKPPRFEFMAAEKKTYRAIDEFKGAAKHGVVAESPWRAGGVEEKEKQMERFERADRRLESMGIDPNHFAQPQITPTRTHRELVEQGVI